MPISIKNDKAELLARELADLTGETLTEAVRIAVGGAVRPAASRTLRAFPERRTQCDCVALRK